MPCGFGWLRKAALSWFDPRRQPPSCVLRGHLDPLDLGSEVKEGEKTNDPVRLPDERDRRAHSRRSDPRPHPALRNAAAKPPLHRHHPRQAAHGPRRAEEGDRDRGSQRLGPPTLVEARRVASARCVPRPARHSMRRTWAAAGLRSGSFQRQAVPIGAAGLAVASERSSCQASEARRWMSAGGFAVLGSANTRRSSGTTRSTRTCCRG